MFDASQPSDPAQASEPARVAIVDGHPVTRLALRQLLTEQPDLRVCGEASNADDALALISRTQPDLAIVELLQGGLDLVKEIRERFPVKILVYSVHDEDVYARRSLRAGASGYVSKRIDLPDVLAAIRQVLAGRVYASPLMAERLVQLATGAGGTLETSPPDRLTDRELQVYKLIGQGLTSAQIAGRLSLGQKTVAAYCEDLKAKLNLGRAAELKYHAIQWTLRNE